MRRGPLALAAVAILAGVGAAASSAFTVRALGGRSAQGLHVTLTRPHSGVRSFSYRARLDCSDGTSFLEDRFADDVRPRRGKFSVHHTSDRGATRTAVAGVIHGNHARGTLRVVERFAASLDPSGATRLDPHGAVTCSSGTVRWSAR
jgi:hypothetical protein